MRQWHWRTMQIVVLLGVVYLTTVTGERPDLVQGAVVAGICAAAILTALLARLLDRLGRGGSGASHQRQTNSSLSRLAGPRRHLGDRPQ